MTSQLYRLARDDEDLPDDGLLAYQPSKGPPGFRVIPQIRLVPVTEQETDDDTLYRIPLLHERDNSTTTSIKFMLKAGVIVVATEQEIHNAAMASRAAEQDIR